MSIKTNILTFISKSIYSPGASGYLTTTLPLAPEPPGPPFPPPPPPPPYVVADMEYPLLPGSLFMPVPPGKGDGLYPPLPGLMYGDHQPEDCP